MGATYDGWISSVRVILYAKCTRLEREDLWDNLLRVALDIDQPKLWGGDFNIIYSLADYSRASQQNLHAIDNINVVLNSWHARNSLFWEFFHVVWGL
ncbi:hypothetical protein ACH5RR_006820 [Cinchona calisaya]|uniref:Endonuclease/exonuclease/phosphatase domain-containing protein n=1 Tax=Cinchona calisaya TaxID=153742 RepID=A0ABD3AQI8_9GENT